MIGNDPLSWMKDEGSKPVENEPASAGSPSESLESMAGDSSQAPDDKGNEDPPETSAAKAKVELHDDDSLTDTVSDQSPALSLVLESSLGVAVAGKLYEGLKSLLDETSAVDVDASKVEKIDACGLQLLLGFVRSAREQDITVCWKQTSAKFVEAAELMGMKSHLGL